VCQRCRTSPLAVEKARAPFVYAGTVREAIHAFKYDGRRRIGLWLASRMARTAAVEFPLSQINAIVPVPLHWAKHRLKGANPSAFLAKAVAKCLAIPLTPGCLRRIRWTPTQTRLGIHQRFGNVRGAFRADKRHMDQAVLLIDDVLTSGATAHACALALRDAGTATVFVLTAACAPQP
jgi:predicted amidophosphoribosyltransferase